MIKKIWKIIINYLIPLLLLTLLVYSVIFEKIDQTFLILLFFWLWHNNTKTSWLIKLLKNSGRRLNRHFPDLYNNFISIKKYLNDDLNNKFKIIFLLSLFIYAIFLLLPRSFLQLSKEHLIFINNTLNLATLISGCAIFWINRGVFRSNSKTNLVVKKDVEKTTITKDKRNQKFYLASAILVCLVFLFFGLNHLGKFMSVDEPKWVQTRVPQLYNAIKSLDFEKTYINDKPGLLPAYLSGITNFFLNQKNFDSSNFEQYLFWWRLPIVIFNSILIFLIYHLIKKLLDERHALISIILIALSPVLIGISQIVNPDATLWSTGFVAFLCFLLYLKNWERKYIILTGIFFGLSLTSKYATAIYYVIFFLIIYIEYSIEADGKIIFFRRLYDLIKIYLISFLVYFIFLPASWLDLNLLYRGTIGVYFLTLGKPIFVILLFFIFADLFFGEKTVTWIKSKINLSTLIPQLLLWLLPITLLFLIINHYCDYYFFDPIDFFKNDYTKTQGSFWPSLLTSMYYILFSLNPIILAGLILTPLIIFKEENENKNTVKLPAQWIILTIFLYWGASSIGGLVANQRYQIILYPMMALLASLVFLKLFKKKLITLIIFGLITLIIVFHASPFYYQYANFINHGKKLTTSWGFGGYELAQILNTKPEIINSRTWADREGVNEFFIGQNKFWRGSDNPFDIKNDIDYLILSSEGKNYFLKGLKNWDAGKRNFYSIIAGETPILQYYEKEAIIKYCININLCYWVVKIDKNDLRVYVIQ